MRLTSILFILTVQSLLAAPDPFAAFGASSSGQPKPFEKGPLSISELPEDALKTEGELTLWTDFNSAKDGQIIVYLINQTAEPVTVPAQDGNPYLKLDGKLEDGTWVRAQPHNYSWCGNSYFSPPTIPPGHFMRFKAWSPVSGTETEVRYSIYSELRLTSNAGRGMIEPDSVKEAKYDAMAIRTGDIELVRTVILKKMEKENSWPRLQEAAVRRLKEFPPEETLEVLEIILHDGDSPQRIVDDAINVYAKQHPEKANEYLIDKLLSGNPETEKHVLLNHNRWLKEDARFLAHLHELADKPANPLRYDAIRILAYRKDEQSKAWLLDLVENAPEKTVHRYARMLKEKIWASTNGIQLRIKTDRNYKSSLEEPIRLEATLVNKSGKELSFSYRSPKDILGLWVTVEGSQVPIESLHDFHSIESTNHAEKVVVLAPKESHQLAIDLRDYFDADQLRKKDINISVRCQLPGIHEMPFIDSSSYSIRIK